ncbi:hypothetical protein ACL02T_32255 [Pseudonocardia sp. RS010]|uniref:hypothetical protein n=1 Tax=Pseudonocardia sp. RS010 TaxID=3385979 RepID=UPI0039A2E996
MIAPNPGSDEDLLVRCPECAVPVLTSDVEQHAAWHGEVARLLAVLAEEGGR